VMKGSRKYTAVWDGLWNQKHVNRMGNSIFLFGFLLSKANGKGQVQITYKVISEEMNVPVRTLGFWMQTLKQKPSPKKKPYITIKKSSSMLIQISNFRSTKKANFGEAVMKNVAEPKAEVMQGSAEPLCKTLPNQLHDLAEPKSVNADKQADSRNPLNVFKIKDKKREAVSHGSSPKKTATNPDVKVAVDHFHDEFVRIHGIKPHVNGAACKTFQTLLNTKSIEQVMNLTTGYLSLVDEKLRDKGYPIEWMQNHINRLLMAEKKPERGLVY
jgi:hypothetical protein